jgi:hypothetical protein
MKNAILILVAMVFVACVAKNPNDPTDGISTNATPVVTNTVTTNATPVVTNTNVVATNTNVAVQQTSAVTLTPSVGVYLTAQSVTLSTTTVGATIYYTVDGATPTTSSSVYSSPISVSATYTTIKAIAVKTGNSNSSVSGGEYTIAPVKTTFNDNSLVLGKTSGIGRCYAGSDTNYNIIQFGNGISFTNYECITNQSTGAFTYEVKSHGEYSVINGSELVTTITNWSPHNGWSFRATNIVVTNTFFVDNNKFYFSSTNHGYVMKRTDTYSTNWQTGTWTTVYNGTNTATLTMTNRVGTFTQYRADGQTITFDVTAGSSTDIKIGTITHNTTSLDNGWVLSIGKTAYIMSWVK